MSDRNSGLTVSADPFHAICEKSDKDGAISAESEKSEAETKRCSLHEASYPYSELATHAERVHRLLIH